MTVSNDDDWMGPVDILVIGFADGTLPPSGLDRLAALAEAGTIRVLDLEIVRREGDGVALVEIAQLPPTDGLDLDFWAGVSSHLLDDDDLAELADALDDGELALVLLIEQQWVLGLLDGWGGGARIVAEGGVAPEDLIDALDAAERREETN